MQVVKDSSGRMKFFCGFPGLVLAALAAVLSCAAHAAKLDLAGVDKTVTDVSELDGYDGVTNTSETPATLTFNLPNSVVQTYNGVIAGNIKLVKQGGKSKLELTRTNTYTGGTQVDGGVIIVSNSMACGDPSTSVVISSFDPNAYKVDGPWCALQFDVSGFSNPITLPAGTTKPKWGGNTYCNHSLCVTNDNISIYSPISGGYFAFLGAKKFSSDSGGNVSAVNFYGPITCTGMQVYMKGNVNFRGAVTNSLASIVGAVWSYCPNLYFYSTKNQFNSTSFVMSRGYVYAAADNVFDGLASFAADRADCDGRLCLQGHEVTIGRTRCVSATAGRDSNYQAVVGGGVLRMQGGADTVSNVRFYGDMSLVWDPTGDYEFVATSNRLSTLTGPVVVKRGTFTLDGGHSLTNVSNIEVLSGAKFKVNAGSTVKSTVVVRTESGTTLDIAEDITVKALKVGGRYLPADDYPAGTYEGLTIAGAGTLHVTSQLGEEWRTSNGKSFPYVYPLYVAEVTAGSSSIEDVTFRKIESPSASVTTDVSYAEFTGLTTTGTIVKCGIGTLSFDKDISTFTGPVHIEDGVAIGSCSNCFGRTLKNGAGGNQRTYVHSGATLVMDAVNNKPVPPESNAIYYEGEGYPGMGGALLTRNGDAASGYSRWQLGCGSRPFGPAVMYFDLPSGCGTHISWGGNQGQSDSSFSLNGQDILMYGRTVGSVFDLEANAINDIGNLVISNMTLTVSGNSGRFLPKNNYESTVRFCGGARWLWNTYENLNGSQNSQTATVFIDDMEYANFCNGSLDGSNYGVNPWGVDAGNTTNNWYRGPVVLNDDFRMYNTFAPRNNSSGNYRRRIGFTLSAQVSGPKGFRPWVDSSGKSWGDGMRINLLYPYNTFEGGIVLDGGSLGVWAERAVPSHEGAGLVSITNGYVYFGRKGRAGSTTKWPEFVMPVTELVGNCAVTNGTGVWKGLVKKGEGTLDYNSQLGGVYLDLREGVVKFNTQYRGAYTGEYAAYAPCGYEAALPEFETLKGTEGVLDLEDAGGAYTVANIECSPSVTNGNLTVTGKWIVDAATVTNGTSYISGTLAFGPESSVEVVGNIEAVPRPGKGFLLAKAAGISGLPYLRLEGWRVVAAGGELRLTKPGFAAMFR